MLSHAKNRQTVQHSPVLLRQATKVWKAERTDLDSRVTSFRETVFELLGTRHSKIGGMAASVNRVERSNIISAPRFWTIGGVRVVDTCSFTEAQVLFNTTLCTIL